MPPEAAFAPIRRIGGRRAGTTATRSGGCAACSTCSSAAPGTRRGRRDPERLLPGDTLDFWRVEEVEPDRLLRLSAEMKLPGRAWLQFEVEPADGGSVIRQTAIFDPVGVLGRLYWYALWPLHGFVFRGMVRGIARAAVAGAPGGGGVAPTGSWAGWPRTGRGSTR